MEKVGSDRFLGGVVSTVDIRRRGKEGGGKESRNR